MKYKVGDRVKVRKDLKFGDAFGNCDFTIGMEEHRGKTVEILGVWEEIGCYRIKEDDGDYVWVEEMFEPIVTNFGKVKEEMKIEQDSFCKAICRIKGEEFCNNSPCKQCREWLKQPYEESKKEILDKAEKEYLSAVIKPFRDKVLHIQKQLGNKGEYIAISLGYDEVYLPYFKSRTMYKGMEIGKGYTLEELGL